MKIHDFEIPVSMSMIDLAKRADHDFQKFFCYWAAFNNIYTLVGQRQGIVSQLTKDNNDKVRFHKPKWGISFPSVDIPGEQDLIQESASQFDDDYKDNLIRHPNVVFFVNRVPLGIPSNMDSREQLINGVINITRTIDPKFPVWSPIDKHAFTLYCEGDLSKRELLAEQLIFILYTIRNNLVHGNKNPGEANDLKVISNALPLLELVVRGFIN